MNIIEKASCNLNLDEGTEIIEDLLINCYLKPGISTKVLARSLFIPVPIAVAIKKELIKGDLLIQDRGVRCTGFGQEYVEEKLDYKHIEVSLYHKILDSDFKTLPIELNEILSKLTEMFSTRPIVNVQLDQSHCTPETSLKRAVLSLKHHSLIGKNILCVGDDDLVSIAIGLLLKRIFPGKSQYNLSITVIDVDQRFLSYIEYFAEKEDLPIDCFYHDMRYPLNESLIEKYDCFFTDPPYTLQGMTLFMTRGVQALKKKRGLNIFLSFAHKSPEFTLKMQETLVEMGLSMNTTLPSFNQYVGAQMIANRSQMIVLQTTNVTKTFIDLQNRFEDPIYTGEFKKTVRLYRCLNCRQLIKVGIDFEMQTIEQLKIKGCYHCHNNKLK